jgi:hypothetical protein
VRAEISPTIERDCGIIIIEGYYTIDTNLLRVYDMAGKLLGTQPVKADNNLEHAARRLLREHSGLSGFYGSLPYRTH